MRVAGYVRVSTDEQAEQGNSLFEQQERMTAYCRAMNWESPTFFIDDGYSAKNLKRPAVDRLVKEVSQQKFDVVLNTKLDRLCRNLLDLLQTVSHFQTYNCAYVSVSEGFDTSTAVGRMTMHVLGAFAEFERERIRERVKDNMISLAKNTHKALAIPCFGYDIIDGHYAINQNEAESVKYIFDLILQGYGHRSISISLNDKGIVTKRGKSWDQINVKRLINNRTLCGTRIFNMRENIDGKIKIRDESEWVVVENNHPAIIEPSIFEEAQEIMNSRKPARKHAESETYLLTGLVYCSHCNNTMGGQTNRSKNKYGEYEYFRYICSSYVRKGGCKYHAVHRNDLESSVINEIRQLASKSNKEVVVITNSRSKEAEKIELKNALAKVDKKMQRQIEAYENELISAEDLKKARTRVENEKERLLKDLMNLENKYTDANVIHQRAKDLIGEIDGIDRKRSKFLIRQLIDQIDYKDGEYSITWRI
ncbi:recombinase family protein [Paenibacillus wynnii]|uniref:Site-specific recombinase n=1 Tax=Paenibacillus wynnii TaxID=268407 RepID=A0A098M7H1_9BACL|nr:recombinase family protein [Paenibacillus wynnii]KGE18485.1 site-specific recombinase [Paenibacillus wynnii]